MLNTNNRKIQNFKNNKRGLYSLYLLLLMLVFTLPAEFIANDKPLLIKYDNNFYFPIIQNYAETVFGGDFETTADYKDSFVTDLIKEKGWIVWPLITIHLLTRITVLVSKSLWVAWIQTRITTNQLLMLMILYLVYIVLVVLLVQVALTGSTMGVMLGLFQ